MSGGGFVKRWMTVPEVASHFSCSRRYVYTLIEQGRLQVINLSGSIGSKGIRVAAESVKQFEQTATITAENYAE